MSHDLKGNKAKFTGAYIFQSGAKAFSWMPPFCCVRRIQLCSPFGVKLQRQTFNYLALWVLRGRFPFKSPATTRTASDSIKAIIVARVTKMQKENEKLQRPLSPQTVLLCM